MLVLSRKKNESIVINNDIVITVVEIRGDKVRLGVVAPKDVPVHREEVYEAIHGVRVCQPPQVNRACDVSGNQPHRFALDPNWLTSTVVALARGIYEERAFDR